MLCDLSCFQGDDGIDGTPGTDGNPGEQVNHFFLPSINISPFLLILEIKHYLSVVICTMNRTRTNERFAHNIFKIIARAREESYLKRHLC